MHHLCYNMAASATFQESQLSFSSRLLALWDRVPNRVGVGVFWTGQCLSWTKTDSNKLAKVGWQPIEINWKEINWKLCLNDFSTSSN